jgi:transposase
MDERRPYPSDLTDEQWTLLAPVVVRPRRADGRGRPPEVDLRAVVNAVLDVRHEGCRWRALPHDSPAWQTVSWYCARWVEDGTLERITDTLRRRLRAEAGRDPEPSAVVSDRQSIKATAKGGTSATTPASR